MKLYIKMFYITYIMYSTFMYYTLQQRSSSRRKVNVYNKKLRDNEKIMIVQNRAFTRI